MQRICTASGQPFNVASGDLDFYKKISPQIGGKIFEIPPPTLCPEERERRRWGYRNERNFYVRKSDFTGKEIVSLYAPDSPFKVYEDDIYWTDKWDPLSYGRDFDFSKTFFENFAALQRDVPRSALNQDYGNENCIYDSFCSYSKNCFLSAGFSQCEDFHYSAWSLRVKNAIGCVLCTESELLYECTDCYKCYNLRFSHDVQSCSDSSFLTDCIGCHHCIGCVNLRNKSFHIFNKPVSKEEFFRIEKEIQNFKALNDFKEKYRLWKITQPHRNLLQVNSEDSTGDHLSQCKNCHFCFDSLGDAQDCGYSLIFGTNVRDLYDCTLATTNCDLLYEVFAILQLYQCCFIHYCNRSENLYYCDNLASCKDCFGCIGLRHNQYCILNKQYTKSEYETLVSRIIEHMQKTGEWGEFFPVTLSPFAYNETVAQEYFPLSKEEVLAKGWRWREETNELPKVDKTIPAKLLPDSIEEVPDDILNWAIECEETGKPFIIQEPELKFYRMMKLPIPHFHPKIRHRNLMAKRNPRKLWQRNCDSCSKGIETTYSPDRPERIFCEECYQKEVY